MTHRETPGDLVRRVSLAAQLIEQLYADSLLQVVDAFAVLPEPAKAALYNELPPRMVDALQDWATSDKPRP